MCAPGRRARPCQHHAASSPPRQRRRPHPRCGRARGRRDVTTLRCVAVVPLAGVKNMPIAGTGFTPDDGVIVRYQSPFSLAADVLDGGPHRRRRQLLDVGQPAAVRYARDRDADLRPQRGRRLQPGDRRGLRPSARCASATRRSPRPACRRAWRVTPCADCPSARTPTCTSATAGRTRRTVKLGKAAAPCGTVSRRLPLLPVKARAGVWTIYVDQSRRYSSNTTPQLSYSLPIG